MSPIPSPVLGPQADLHTLNSPHSPVTAKSDDSSNSDGDDDDDDDDGNGNGNEGDPKRSPTARRSRRARFHDATDDAMRIAKAITGEKDPDVEPLMEILPALAHPQIMELRGEYKRLVKTGAQQKASTSQNTYAPASRTSTAI